MQVFCHFTAHGVRDAGPPQAEATRRRLVPLAKQHSTERSPRARPAQVSQKSTIRRGAAWALCVDKSPGQATSLAAWLLLSCLLLWPLPATAVEVTEPGSGQRFASPLTFLEKTHTLVGTGLRKRDNQSVYAMALYVEDSARQSFPAAYDRGNRTRAGLFSQNRAHNFFIWGHFSKLAVLRFLRAQSRQELLQQFSEPLAELLTEKSAPELRQDTLTFLGLLDTDVREGQELRVYSSDLGQIDVYIDGKKHAGPQNPKLARHIWEIWLGFRPVQPQMRQTLLERLDVLAHLPRPEKAAPTGKTAPAAKPAKYPPLRTQ